MTRYNTYNKPLRKLDYVFANDSLYIVDDYGRTITEAFDPAREHEAAWEAFNRVEDSAIRRGEEGILRSEGDQAGSRRQREFDAFVGQSGEGRNNVGMAANILPKEYSQRGRNDGNGGQDTPYKSLKEARQSIEKLVSALPKEERSLVMPAFNRFSASRDTIASMTGKRLAAVYSDYSYGGNKTKGYLTYISPSDFIALTTSDYNAFMKRNQNSLNEGTSEDWGTENNIPNLPLTDRMGIIVCKKRVN